MGQKCLGTGFRGRQNAAVALLLKNNTYKSTGLSGMDIERDLVVVRSSTNATCAPWFVHSDDTNIAAHAHVEIHLVEW